MSLTDSFASFLHTRSWSIGVVFWVLALAAMPIWTHYDKPGWDVAIYRNAIAALQAGHDPYLDAMAVQRAFHVTLAQHPNDTPPYSYVYSPVTLPLIHSLGVLPLWFSGTIYCLAVALGAFVPLYIILRLKQTSDTDFLRIVAPIAIFFPGLLAQDTILSGNLAFVLYGIVLLGAYYGWRRHQWRWCYLAILAASVFKAPLLCLLAIPFFSARKQWLPTVITAGAGLGLFAVQSVLWPSLFHHFLQAVELQFSYNRDFGSSPAGIFSYLLTGHGRSYSPFSEIFYIAYALLLCVTLFYLSRKFLDGSFTLSEFIPVLLVGAILLNPRVMEYDLAPIALPMALIGWRFVRRIRASYSGVLLYFIGFVVANLIGAGIAGMWKPTECVLLIATFVAGCWTLLHPSSVKTEAVSHQELYSVNMA